MLYVLFNSLLGYIGTKQPPRGWNEKDDSPFRNILTGCANPH